MNASQGINAPGAWDLNTGSNSVVVAVIDTGVDYNHTDLKANMWVNPNEIAGNPYDDNGHGTHVAGTIGAKGNNGKGVAGVNWNVKIMALKFLDANGAGGLADAIEVIDYMVAMKNRGVNIVVSNNSWGGGGYSQPLYDAILRAHQAGIIFAAAAGNAASDNDSFAAYPASYDISSVVSVASHDSQQNLSSFSNYGASSVDIAAPGSSIYSTYPGNSYSTLSGTSMATPHVSGALALLAAHSSSLTPSQLINRMYDSGSDLTSLNSLVRTRRKLNVSRMLRNLTSPVPAPAPEPTGCDYDIDEISYSPDLSADSKAIVLQADEYGYYTVDLPFLFPFHGGTTEKVILSPNGVIYTKSAPGAMDYVNTGAAPINSIAALHSDLISSVNPNGVRVNVTSSKVTVYWRAKHYSNQTLGDIHVRTTLFSNGKVRNYIDFDTAALQVAVQSNATVGLTGPSSSSAITYASNNSDIRDLLAIEYTPLCTPSESLSVSNIDVSGINRNGRLVRRSAKSAVMVDLSGAGTGSVVVQAGFNNQLCPNTVTMNMTNGLASKTISLNRAARKYKKIFFQVNSLKDSVRIKSKKKAKRRTSALLEKACSIL
ncbi:UNVERIFIED_CONTAM: hypothetical protein GTU68_049749 [Idotea baltica]|nr:hypothetical protein [Idotea baltica]